MTSELAWLSMLMGVGGGSKVTAAPTIPNSVQYIDYETSMQDYEYDGVNDKWVYGERKTVPKDSLVFTYIKNWETDGIKSYKYLYYIYQLIIENIDTASEEVVGIIDKQTGIEYYFQFNRLGGR